MLLGRSRSHSQVNMSELINAHEVSFAELLRSGLFRVPNHQRYYDWDKSHVETLLLDLREAVDEDRECFFLGSVMLIKTNTENVWEINDGQQRVVTVSLICAYLCRLFHQRNLSREETNSMRVLFNVPEGHSYTLDNSESCALRVTPPRNNKINYNLLARGKDVGKNGSMVTAWQTIANFFEADASFQDIDLLKKFMDFLLQKVIVVRLEVDQSLDAHAIFETLNYRGKQLSQVDLIKNYFFSFFRDEDDARVDTMHENFEIIHVSFHASRVAEYVRCFMQTHYGFINKEQFFRETKNIFGAASRINSKKIFDLTGDLASGASINAFKTIVQKSANEDYLRQLTADAGKNRVKNKNKIQYYLMDLQSYTIAYPILFALFRAYIEAGMTQSAKQKEVAKYVHGCAQLLSSFVQRVVQVTEFKPSTYEEKFAEIAKRITDGKCPTKEQFLAELEKIDTENVIDDKVYIALLAGKIYPRKSTTKQAYILKRIEKDDNQGADISDGNVSVEHILPKSPKHYEQPAWQVAFQGAHMDTLIPRLGNLTLLEKGKDSSKPADNASFNAKKKIYKTSSLEMTKDLCNHDEWNQKVIKQRQRKLAKSAAKIWNFDL